VFPSDGLHKRVRPSEGDLFDAGKTRERLDNVRKRCGSSGHIDFAATPIVKADEAARRMSLVMELDPHEQFRIGKVLSSDTKMQTTTEFGIYPGMHRRNIWSRA
jgi:hypothetical protein